MPLPKRYFDQVPEISRIWEPEGYFNAQIDIWKAQCEARSILFGKPNRKELIQIKNKLKISSKDIENLSEAKGHETNKLLKLLQSRMPLELGNFLHKGNTSSDVLDTSLALQILESLKLIEKYFEELKDSLGRLALKHRKTLQIGRTHTQHAIPQTFGRQVVGWYAEIKRGIDRIKRAKEVISVGKLSGEIGTSVFIDPQLEDKALIKLGLRPDEAPTQIVSRDRHAEVLALLAINSSTLARIAENIRLLSMTEVGEVREPFGDQQGSSSMPHKRNPELSERVKGLSRIIRSSALSEIDSVITWLERDISHSSTERFTFPDVFGNLAYACKLTTRIINGLDVDSKKMKANIDLSFGSIYSSRLMNVIIDSGKASRTEAYELVKALSLKAMSEKKQLLKIALIDKKVLKFINQDKIKEVFDHEIYLRNIDLAYKRVGLL